jgi:hypothetical protein
MSVEMPQWCGRCDPTTRRFDLGDRERRCPECNPFWAFGHSSVDPARVPAGHTEQEQAARWLLYEVVGLRSLQPMELRRRTKRFFDAGWTPLDVLHALDNDPDGSPARSVPLPGDPPDRMERQILNLLGAWCDADGVPLPSPTQAAIQRRERRQERQRAQQEAWAQLAARPIDPDAAERSGARRAAALATRKAQEMRVEAKRRERAVRAASAELAREQEARMAALMERLDRLTRSITSPQRAWEADWAVAPHESWVDGDGRDVWESAEGRLAWAAQARGKGTEDGESWADRDTEGAREAVLLHDVEPFYSIEACEEGPASEPAAGSFTCEADIDDTVPLREIGLRMIRARRDGGEVTPSAAENETAVGRPLWISVRGSTSMSAGRTGGPRRRAA